MSHPVDHSAPNAVVDQHPPTPSTAPSTGQCPVSQQQPKARSLWLSFFSKVVPDPDHANASTSASACASGPACPSPASSPPLSTARTASSIPRPDAGTWTYPSEAQFFAAMARKRHQPRAADMRVIVPIHNAVNERAWGEVAHWERGRGGERCGGVKLVSFMGRPGERSWKAWMKVLLGYTPPFDRHDWVVDRCGTRMRYIIDFYTGHNAGGSSGAVSFYLDVRPAMDNWEGIQMRFERFWERWFGNEDPTAQTVKPKT